MAIRIAVWVTISLLVLIVVMAGLAEFAPEGSELQDFGAGFFRFLDRIAPGS